MPASQHLRRAAWPLVTLALFWGALRVERRAQSAGAADDCRTPTGTAAMERCLAAHPEDVELMVDLAQAYETANAADRAEALYRRASGVDPLDGDVHSRLAAVLLQRGDPAGALREAGLALRTQPGNRAALALEARARAADARR